MADLDPHGAIGESKLLQDAPPMTRDDLRLLDQMNREGTSHDQEMAVVFAETTAFDSSQRPRLLAELAAFITRNRFTRDRNAITAVGSALRKYAMNMDEAQFELYGGWLRPSDTEKLGTDVELELVKALCWRLSYVPVLRRDCPRRSHRDCIVAGAVWRSNGNRPDS